MSTCREIEALLSPFVDGELAGDERAAVVAHLDACANCRGLAADLERVRGAARLLGPITPPEHVWLEVAGRTHRDSAIIPVATGARHRRASLPQWLGLAAALVVVTMGLYIVDVLRAPRSPVTAVPSSADSVQTVAQELSLALEHYDKAIAELQVMARKNEGTLDPAVAQTLQRNLSVIDRAIVESRAALGTNPGSEPARETLLDALQRKISVLQTTVALVNEMGKGDAAGAARVVGGKS